MHKHVISAFLIMACVMIEISSCGGARKTPPKPFPKPQVEFAPLQYVCFRMDSALSIDGKLDEPAWSLALWTDYFVDIEGGEKPNPRFKTRAKMLWDSSYFYFAADLQEPDVWGTLTQRDAVIFHDNDFEIFIDPDGDTHEYYEFEMNALNTVWDLLLVKPYRDGGPAVDAWDIQGLKTAVAVDGTLNQPGDVDRGWTVEIAMPWTVLRQCAHRDAPPHEGDQWRVNFSRVEWQTEVLDSTYRKLTDLKTKAPLPESNWVWSPQGLINMHFPEMWGYVQFTEQMAGSANIAFRSEPSEGAKWILRRIYYGEKDYFNRMGQYTDELAQLKLGRLNARDVIWPPQIFLAPGDFEASLRLKKGNVAVYISSDGRTRIKSPNPANAP